jgi:hypothetical protein
MPATKYTYSIFSDFPNHIVATDRLSQEIRASSIVTVLQGINTIGDVCDIWFAAALSGPEQTTLNGLVAVHSGTPLPQDYPVIDDTVAFALRDGVTQLTISGFTDGKFLKRSGTTLIGASAGGSVAMTEIEIDFGSSPRRTGVFALTDAEVTTGSTIIAVQSQSAATGRHADENEMDQISFSARPTTAGNFLLIARPLCGAVHGKYKVIYTLA